MKKRMITICVLAAMLLSCASCGSTETGNDETTKSGGTDTTVGDTTAEPTEYDKYPLPEKDMDGFNLRFCNYDDSWLTWTIKISTSRKRTATSSTTPSTRETAASRRNTTAR